MRSETGLADPLASQPIVSGGDRLLREPAQRRVLRCLSAVESADPVFLMRQTGLSWDELSWHVADLDAAGCLDRQGGSAAAAPSPMLSLTEQGRLTYDVNRRWRFKSAALVLLSALSRR